MQDSATTTHFASPSISYGNTGTYDSSLNISSPPTSGGFVKASSLLLNDSEEEAWYDLALIRCENCTYAKIAGCYCLDSNSGVNNLKNIH